MVYTANWVIIYIYIHHLPPIKGTKNSYCDLCSPPPKKKSEITPRKVAILKPQISKLPFSGMVSWKCDSLFGRLQRYISSLNGIVLTHPENSNGTWKWFRFQKESPFSSGPCSGSMLVFGGVDLLRESDVCRSSKHDIPHVPWWCSMVMNLSSHRIHIWYIGLHVP